MPFRHVEDAKLREAMAKAFDLACATLNIDGNDPRSGKLATIIIQLGEKEREPEMLADRALEELRKINKKKFGRTSSPTG
jgi:hypothetical protein